MGSKLKFTFVLVLFVFGVSNCQDAEEPAILESQPIEVGAEGSGEGAIGSDSDVITVTVTTPKLQEIDAPNSGEFGIQANSEVVSFGACDVCTCSSEGQGDAFTMTVDCSNTDLTDIPNGIDGKVTTLYLQNNKLEKLSKTIAALKNLRILNVENNSLKEIEFGSVSELPELRILKLANNRLLEYPQELKNSFGLTKLEVLDLNGNDIREKLSAEIFTQHKELREIYMLELSNDIKDQLCLKNVNLQKVCSGTTCYDCPDSANHFDEYMPVLPGLIAADNEDDESNVDPSVQIPKIVDDKENKPESNETTETTTEFSLRSAVNAVNSRKAFVDPNSAIFNKNEDMKADSEVKVGASSNDATTTGGVSTLVIGLVVAGMALVVAAVVIKKNWASIKKSLGSNQQPSVERAGSQANGTTPEEVPLQEKDKSPV